MNWDAFWNHPLLFDLAVLFTVTTASYLILSAALGIASKRLDSLSQRRRAKSYFFAAQLLRNTSRLLVLAFSLLIGLKVVELSPRWQDAMSHGWFIALAFQIALWLDMAVRLWTESLTRDGKARNPVTTTIIGIMIRIVVWTMMLLSILANLGVDITAMVASLGVGGIAIALAVQTLLSDIFASLSIGIDKPFEIGDFVVFGDEAGNIEHIGLKTTRIRSLSGEQIVCANADLLSQTLHNYKRMQTRRIVFRFGVSYRTSSKDVREVGQMVRRVIEAADNTRFDRAHFAAFDDSQLTFEVVHIVQTADYNEYMNVQQEINIGIMEGLEAMGVEFAFPTRSIEFIGGTLPDIKLQNPPMETAMNSSG